MEELLRGTPTLAQAMRGKEDAKIWIVPVDPESFDRIVVRQNITFTRSMTVVCADAFPPLTYSGTARSIDQLLLETRLREPSHPYIPLSEKTDNILEVTIVATSRFDGGETSRSLSIENRCCDNKRES